MKKWLLLVPLLLGLSLFCSGQAVTTLDQNCGIWGANPTTPQCGGTTAAASGTQLFLPDIRGTITNQFEVLVQGTAPATLTITVVGCMRGGTCSGTLASSSGTASQILTPAATSLNVYDKYGITVTWTGGDATTRFVVNRTGTVAKLSGSGTGTVTTGTTNQIAIYAVNGTTLSGSNKLIGAINAQAYGVLADVQIVFDASWTNGANPATVTTTGSDPCFVAGDVGKIMFGTNWSNPAQQFYQASTVTLPQGTITSVTDCNHAVVSTVPTATQTTNGTFAWGHDDATGLSNAYTAAGSTTQCLSLILPAGVMFSSTGQFNSATCVNNLDTQLDRGIGVSGWPGRATMIVPLPSLSISNSATCNGTNNSCFFGTAGAMTTHDVVIDGLGNGATGFPSAKSCIGLGTDSYLWETECDWWGQSDGNFQGLKVSVGSTVDKLVLNSAGSVGLHILNGAVSEILNSFVSASLTNNLLVDAGGYLTSYSTGWGPSGTAASFHNIVNGELRSYNDQFFNGSSVNSHLLQVNNGGLFVCSGTRFVQTGNGQAALRAGNGGTDTVFLRLSDGCRLTNSTASGFALVLNGANVRAVVKDTDMSAPTGGNQILTANSAFYQDMGGNTFSGAGTLGLAAWGAWQGISGISSQQGVCTGTATSSATIGLYGLGTNTATTCTSTSTNLGVSMTKNGNVIGVLCTASHAGVNASSGVVTVLKNNVSTTTTCTFGTTTSCIDQAHSSAFSLGDVLSVQFTTQAAEVLAGVNCTVMTN